MLNIRSKSLLILVYTLQSVTFSTCQYGQTGYGSQASGYQNQNGQGRYGQSTEMTSGYPQSSQHGQESHNRYNNVPSTQYGYQSSNNPYAGQQSPHGRAYSTGQTSYGSQLTGQRNSYDQRNSYGQQSPYGQATPYGQQNQYGRSGVYGQGSGYGRNSVQGQGAYGGQYSPGSYLSDRQLNTYGTGHMGTGENALARSLYERGVTPQTDTLSGTEYERGGQNAIIPNNGNGCRQIVLAPYAKFLYGRPCDGSIGSRCYLTCEPGFDLIGSCFRVCGTDRRWSGSEMLCVRPAITCPAPNFQTSIRIIAGCQNMAGFSCTLGCKNGGVPTAAGLPLRRGMIYCQVEGRWSQDPSLITCGASGSMGREAGEGIAAGERGIYGNERGTADAERRGVNTGTLGNEMSRGQGNLDGQINPATGEGINGRSSGALNGLVEGEGRSIAPGKSLHAISCCTKAD